MSAADIGLQHANWIKLAINICLVFGMITFTSFLYSGNKCGDYIASAYTTIGNTQRNPSERLIFDAGCNITSV